MSTKHADLLHAVQNGKKLYQAFAEGEALLQTLVGLEQNERELKSAVDELRLQYDTWTAKIDAAKMTAAEVVKKAETRAQEMKVGVESYAKEIRTDADKYYADAKKAADDLTRSTDEVIRDRQDQYNNLESKIRGQRAILESLESRIAEAKEVVAKILA
jgi:vacuolar-type H+-ATPase subunit H